MITQLPLYEFSRLHFDNAIAYTRSVSRAHLDRLVRRRAALTLAYVALMDEVSPGWRDTAVDTIRKDPDRKTISVGDIGLESTDTMATLYLADFKIAEATDPPNPT